MPDGGRLVIRTSNETVEEEITVDAQRVPAGDYVTLTVSDTGTGIDDATMAHLFEPFFTTKETGKGTGLGLSTVYGIVKQSGGEILVRSQLGAGSSFTVYLPRLTRSSQPVPGNGVKLVPAFGGSETILLVEDDGALRNLARRVLSNAGYAVLEARTAHAAIELGTTHPGRIDLVLTDVVMPQINGRAVGERLTALRPGICVLFMSGYTDDVVMKRGIRSAHTNFLQKPFTPEQLTRRIREVLDARPLAERQAALETRPTRSA
jgi:two-component system, cell cycle sensor histidine kinase and response regulator CckA